MSVAEAHKTVLENNKKKTMSVVTPSLANGCVTWLV